MYVYNVLSSRHIFHVFMFSCYFVDRRLRRCMNFVVHQFVTVVVSVVKIKLLVWSIRSRVINTFSKYQTLARTHHGSPMVCFLFFKCSLAVNCSVRVLSANNWLREWISATKGVVNQTEFSKSSLRFIGAERPSPPSRLGRAMSLH